MSVKRGDPDFGASTLTTSASNGIAPSAVVGATSSRFAFGGAPSSALRSSSV
jgi:hypothetical protein